MAQNERVEFAVFSRLLARFLPPDPPSPMPGDGADPTAETGRLLELRQGLESQQKGLLSQIFRCFPRTERLHRDHDDRAPVAGHEFVERFEIAQKRVQDQLLVADMRVSARVLCHSLHSSCKEETAPTRKDRGTAQLFSESGETRDSTGHNGSRCARSASSPSRYAPW
jgi:hypothetical protein